MRGEETDLDLIGEVEALQIANHAIAQGHKELLNTIENMRAEERVTNEY